MYEVRNEWNVVVQANGMQLRSSDLINLKKEADRLHEKTGKHYSIFKAEQVWTTQTRLAINS